MVLESSQYPVATDTYGMGYVHIVAELAALGQGLSITSKGIVPLESSSRVVEAMDVVVIERSLLVFRASRLRHLLSRARSRSRHKGRRVLGHLNDGLLDHGRRFRFGLRFRLRSGSRSRSRG